MLATFWRHAFGSRLARKSITAIAFCLSTAGSLTAQTATDIRPVAPRLAAEAAVLDLNSAGAAELASLPGMGPAYARRIVEFRPYSAKNQLVTRGVLPQAAYEQIKERVVAHRPARP